MRQRKFVFVFLALLCAAAGWLVWYYSNSPAANTTTRSAASSRTARTVITSVHSLSTAPQILASTNAARALAAANTNKMAFRLTNTRKTIGQLTRDSHAILLENAVIDTTEPLNFNFPKNLQSKGDPGAYIVQAKGPITQAFRQMLARAGATIVAYIPNDAYLVRADAGVAGALGSDPLTQTVIPYEPYYKLQSSLLAAILQNHPLPSAYNVAVFPGMAGQTRQELQKAGWDVLSQQSSPFGDVLTVQGTGDVTALAGMREIHIIEPAYKRVAANDLSRVTDSVATDSQTATNYLGLTGAGVMVEMNDTGVDAKHPDLTGRVIGDLFDTNLIGRAGLDLVDTNGHGTHVAGIIAGDGTESATLTNVSGSVMPGTNGQFRGMAPKATLFSVAVLDNNGLGNFSDQSVQEIPALTNALISNNSWDYGDNNYDLSSASYDAATRDALPMVTGSQPVLFVFAAGNSGGGDDNGFGGVADTILSPATAKNVLTVGALEQLRQITNIVTDLNGNKTAIWKTQTDSGNQVAFFSSRGNVGINFEGAFGRYKPDVVAPGSFVVSTRSGQWDEAAYYNPTNDNSSAFADVLGANGINYYTSLFIPSNTVQMSIDVVPDILSSTNFVAPTIYLWQGTDPRVSNPNLAQTAPIQIPPDSALSPLNTTWTYAISNNTSDTLFYDVFLDIITTNDFGDYLTVLSNLNDSLDGDLPPHYYRYESGTSMSAANVSGILALMQEYLTNSFNIRPSPALMKAMLINGARSEPNYDFNVDSSINFQGWGLINLTNTLQLGIANQTGVDCDDFFIDQSPTNALATGQSHTYMVTVNTNAFAQFLPLRVTLAWTDPPGDPAAAVKLVNSLELVVTNLDDPTNAVYYGNDIASGATFNTAESPGTNAAPVDVINNVQNVFIGPMLGSHYSVTVIGREVNVNAVSAQTNDVVQDYALAISCGEDEVTNAIQVTSPTPTFSNPTGDQLITFVTTTNQPLLNQFAGASSPLLGTNDTLFSTNTAYGNAQVTIGQTNQWHFYVVHNTGTNSSFTNAAFVTFDPNTLSIPRMGVFAGSQDNATTPESDIDIYVASGPGASALTNLDPTVISNCINANGNTGTQVGASLPAGVNGTFYGASLDRGGTEFVVDTNSTPGQVYYIGVKSERQVAAEYDFIPFFSNIPFSQNDRGNEIVNVQPLPISIPEGTPAFSQPAFCFGLALYSIPMARVIVTNVIPAQNFGDLIGTLSHPNQGLAPTSVVLNNHDSLGNTINDPGFVYDDSGLVNGSTVLPAGYQWRRSTGPGSLNSYVGKNGAGVWILTESDSAPGQQSSISSSTLFIQRLQKLGTGLQVFDVPALGWAYGFLVVPPGATNLIVTATNMQNTANPPLELFDKYGSLPDTNNFDQMAVISNLTAVPTQPPSGSFAVTGSVTNSPPLLSGIYFVGIYNPSLTEQTNVWVFATIGIPFVPAQTIYNSLDTPIPIPDDAVTDDTIDVTDNTFISSVDVAIAVQHPRISDLVFHLISPDGTRVLLMENRGGLDPNGAGGIATIGTNTPLATNFEAMVATNYTTGTVGGWNVAAGQVTVQTDPANAYQGTSNYLALANGTLSTTVPTVPGATYTLQLACRGPGIVSWWRGQSNATGTVTYDAISGNNGTLSGGASFAPGWVTAAGGQSLQFNGGGSVVRMGDPGSLKITNSFTIEGWENSRGYNGLSLILFRGDSRTCLDPYYLSAYYVAGPGPSLHIGDANPNGCGVDDVSSSPLPLGQWQYLAGVFDSVAGTMKLYVNGVLIKTVNTTLFPFQNLDPNSNPEVSIGNFGNGGNDAGFNGSIDELSIYHRALSASEIQTIYNYGSFNNNPQGGNGKFDPVEYTNSPAQSLAELQVSINGVATNFYADNTNWQNKTLTFKATGSATQVQITGMEPGVLLSTNSVSAVFTNYNYLVFTENTNLTTTPIKFAVPPFNNTNGSGYIQWQTAFGGNGHWYKAVANPGLTWSQCDAAASSAGGYLATITSPAENDFVFSNVIGNNGIYFNGPNGNGSGPAIGGIDNGPTATNWTWETGEAWTWTPYVYPWYAGQPDGPPPARLVYFSNRQGVPAETWDDLGPNDFNVGGYVIERNALPNYDLPEQSLDTYDGTYAPGHWTLEVQDDRVGATNPPPILLSWQLRFTYVTLGTNVEPGTPLALPQLPEQTAYTGLPFTVTNAASGGTPPYTYTLSSSVPFAPFPTIDTNGVITWAPNTNFPAPAVYTFTNIVTDITTAMATDIFQVLLLPTNSQPAFPGAEGPGGPAIGGRGGDVYHVINVNDGGPGSLRYGITNTFGSRTIVFDVSGTITLSNKLNIDDPYLTIAGQTAPGDGITIRGYTTSVENSHDDVIRFLRCRPGDMNSPYFQDDSFHFVNVTNSIADHISASWSIDEALSSTYSTNVTVQWSVIADPLNHSAHYMDSGAPGFQAHGYGSLIRYGSGAISYHHDLYADDYSRNPRPGDNIQLDFINNVVFNWGIFAGYNEDDSASNTNGYTNYLNYVGNYFIAGSNTTANPNIAFQANVPNAAFTQIYQSTNFIDNNASTKLLNGIDTGWGMFSGNYTQLAAPTSLPGMAITETNPPDAYEQVLAFAGATVAGASAGGEYLLRDTVDTNIVTGVRNKSGQIIDFISSSSFPGVYLNTNSESTYTNYTGAGTYWKSQGITNFVGINPWPVLDSAPQTSDTDGDGIPDYWETTLAALGQTGMDPLVPNNNHLNPDGYTDLEHYNNWLAGPHALTVSNTPVDVDLYGIVGRTGDWAFGVTNGTNGTVTLGLDGHTATFMPTNNFFGFASFDFSATNLFTSNRLDVTVSVMVSMTNITYSSVLLTAEKSGANASTNIVPGNSIFYYLVKVPTNALFATNQLLTATGPVNLWFSGVGFPTGTNIGDYRLLAGATSGSSVLSTTSVPTNIVQGGTYYLGVQNLSGGPVTVGVEVDFGYTPAPPTVFISGPTITATNIGGTNGFLLRWTGLTNYQYTIQWATNIAPPIPWNTVVNPVINLVATPTNGNYSWFDDGTLAGGFPPVKFYRVIAGQIPSPITNSTPVTNIVFAGSITPLTVSVPANATAATNLLISATGPLNVYFNQTTPPTGTNAGDVLMLSASTGGTFVLNGSSVPPLVPGANYYLGLQNPGSNNVSFVFEVNFAFGNSTNAPTISNITFTNSPTNGILLTWYAPTNYQFQVQWTTNLPGAGSWTTIPGVVLTNLSSFIPTNGIGKFQYFDDGSLTGGFGTQKFYRLIAYPPGTTIPASVIISKVVASPGGLQIQWNASANYVYDVAWTTNLALPTANWSVLSNLTSPTLTYSNGVCTFTDDGSLTGGAAASKFFKVLLMP